MRCKKIISSLNAYVDGELPERQRRIVKDHLASCEACRRRLEEIRKIDLLFQGTLPVPPVPDGLAMRIITKARKRQSVRDLKWRLASLAWNPFKWVAEFSAAMKLAACITVLLALVLGLSLDGRGVTGRNMYIEPEKNLYGLEWFDPAPPGSISSAYIAMVTQTYQEGNR